MTTNPLTPSSSTQGFFTEKPALRNQFHEDVAFKRINNFYLPSEALKSINPELSGFGDKVLSPQILTWTGDAERNIPYLKTWDSFGKRKDELVTSEGWRNLQDVGISEGIVAIPYENRHGSFSRVHQFLKFHLWCGSSANVGCPSAMTDGAARLLSRHLSSKSLSRETRAIYQSAYDRLTSRDPRFAWTSGQWMTERQGGSDVSRTETIAIPVTAPLDSQSVDGFQLGPWSISGFKWFSSATDANMAILLARTPDDRISTFFAPVRRTVPSKEGTELNGVSIQRLKVKYGTKSLPTAELELKDMRGYLLGEQGYGIKEIATILNITRVHTAVGTMGGWGRGLAISRAFARVRIVGGKKLIDIPAHVKVMAEQEVEYRGYMHLTFFSVLILGISEQTTTSPTAALGIRESLARIMPDQKDAMLLLRILTPVVKATTAKAGIAGLSECMESLGGVGYLENEEMEFNIARLLRDAAVSAIWEGTTDVLATDLLKVLKGRQGREIMTVLEKWLGNAGLDKTGLAERFVVWKDKVNTGALEMLKVYGRDLMFELGRIIGGCLLKLDADIDGCELASEIHRRWVDGRPALIATKFDESVEMDRRIVFEGRIPSTLAKL